MFERYTEKARRVIFFARYEAAQFGSPFIETEHMLLGLLKENRELAIRFLKEDGSVEGIRRQIKANTTLREKVSTSVDLPLSHESKRVLSFAADEAERLSHKQIDAEHLLLGLLREEECFAANILHERGLRLSLVRAEIAKSTVAEDRRGSRIEFDPRYRSGSAAQHWAGSMFWHTVLQDAGRVLQLARHEAAERRSPLIETMDVLLALTCEKDVAERFLGSVESIRKSSRQGTVPTREKVAAPDLPFSEDCNRVFTFASQEAAQLGQRTGPAHLLLGILRVEACAAAEILRESGVTAEGIRVRLAPPPPPIDPEQGRSYV